MSRRGENIRKRKDGRWEARYPSGVNDKGQKTYSSVYGDTYKEAKEKRNWVLQHQNSYPKVLSNKPLFSEILELWITDNRIHLKNATIYRYSYLIETHILPELGGIQVDQITSTVINAFLAKKLSDGRIDGRGGLSTAYVRSIMLVINSALQFATENRLCNPLLTQIHKPPLQSKELAVLSKDEQKKLESVLLTDMNETKLGIYISLYTGLRIGEICALSWEDIDIANRTIYVRHTLTRIRVIENGKTVTKNSIDTPKTKSSLRCIPICSTLAQVLNDYLPNVTSEYVVSNKAGFVSPRTFEYRYKKIMKESKISFINYHGLRHTFATRCIESGVDVKSLSEILGHANVSITLNTYVHSSMELKRAQIEKLVASSV